MDKRSISGPSKENRLPNSGIDASIDASIAVDSEGYVHISYYDNGNSSYKYATNRP